MFLLGQFLFPRWSIFHWVERISSTLHIIRSCSVSQSASSPPLYEETLFMKTSIYFNKVLYFVYSAAFFLPQTEKSPFRYAFYTMTRKLATRKLFLLPQLPFSKDSFTYNWKCFLFGITQPKRKYYLKSLWPTFHMINLIQYNQLWICEFYIPRQQARKGLISASYFGR